MKDDTDSKAGETIISYDDTSDDGISQSIPIEFKFVRDCISSQDRKALPTYNLVSISTSDNQKKVQEKLGIEGDFKFFFGCIKGISNPTGQQLIDKHVESGCCRAMVVREGIQSKMETSSTLIKSAASTTRNPRTSNQTSGTELIHHRLARARDARDEVKRVESAGDDIYKNYRDVSYEPRLFSIPSEMQEKLKLIAKTYSSLKEYRLGDYKKLEFSRLSNEAKCDVGIVYKHLKGNVVSNTKEVWFDGLTINKKVELLSTAKAKVIEYQTEMLRKLPY